MASYSYDRTAATLPSKSAGRAVGVLRKAEKDVQQIGNSCQFSLNLIRHSLSAPITAAVKFLDEVAAEPDYQNRAQDLRARLLKFQNNLQSARQKGDFQIILDAPETFDRLLTEATNFGSDIKLDERVMGRK